MLGRLVYLTFKGRPHDIELVPHVAVHLCRRYGERVMTDIYAVARKIAQVLVHADRRFCVVDQNLRARGITAAGKGV